jgi:hypothetical protein
MSVQQDRDTEPRTNVRRSYERCLAVRQQWRSIRAKTVDEAVRDEAHGDLHEGVMAWFETLVPYISDRPGEVKELWENAPLYPVRQASTEGVQCGSPECGAAYARTEEGPGPGDICPVCEQIPLEPAEVVQAGDDGEPLYEWACGLKRLASWSSETETKVIESGEWETGQQRVEVPKRLDPDILMRAARFLDIAAEECGLLEDTDRALATGEL